MSLSFRHAAFTVVLLFVVFTVHAKTASEIYEQAARSTVVVENIDNKGGIAGLGSGVVLPDGNVVTNCHVIKDASQLKVRSNKNKFPAALQFSDLDRDICSLSIVGLNAPAVMIGSTKMLKVGAKVFAIGAPKGLELTLSDGIVSSLREVEGGHYIQITAAISPGSSGGGLFDENGTLVGLTTFFITEGQNLNFAVPVEWVTELAIRSINAEQRAEAEHKAQAEQRALAKQKVQAERRAEAERKAEMEQRFEVERRAEAEQKVEAERKTQAKLKALAEKKEQAEEKERAKQRAQAEQELLAEQEEQVEQKTQAEQQAKVEQEPARAEQKAQAEQERARAAQAAAIGKAVSEYKAKIIAKIRRNIVLLPDISSDVIAEFEVTLLPGGMVLNAKLVKTSGSAAYDTAVERAIKKAEPFPVPPDIALFDMFRELHLKFSPIVKYDRLPSCSGSYETATWTYCFGEYTYSSGTKYVGEFKDDKFNGQGTLTLPDGTKYVGEFKDDKFNGQEQDAKKKQVENAIAAHKTTDFESEVKKAQPAAAQDGAEAQYNLGNKYYYGQGVTQNYVEALKWYELAAAQGHATAQNNLGSMHKNGKGVAQDYAEALKWYRLSAVQGMDIAQFNLGVMYDYGQGVTQDYAEALKLYRLSAAQGFASAQFSLGYMYRHGQGVVQNYAEAVKWFRLAAVQGDAQAFSLLGAMYFEGKGITQDYVRAHMWLNLGAASGDIKAVKLRDIVETLLTSQQIAQAQQMASDCKQKNFKECE